MLSRKKEYGLLSGCGQEIEVPSITNYCMKIRLNDCLGGGTYGQVFGGTIGMKTDQICSEVVYKRMILGGKCIRSDSCRCTYCMEIFCYKKLDRLKVTHSYSAEFFPIFFGGFEAHIVNLPAPNNFVFLVMERCETDAFSFKRKINPFSQDAFIDLSTQLLEAQRFLLMVANIVHIDVKPNNILFDFKSFTFKVCDFGLALEKRNGQRSLPSSSLRRRGTARYMPIEITKSPRNAVNLEKAIIYQVCICIVEIFFYRMEQSFAVDYAEMVKSGGEKKYEANSDISGAKKIYFPKEYSCPAWVTGEEIRGCIETGLYTNPIYRPDMDTMIEIFKNSIK